MTLDDRVIRWQKQSIKQLSAAINLFSAMALAALGFSVVFLKEESFRPSTAYAAMYMSSIVCLGLAVILSTAATVTRLLDFRGTAEKVRLGKSNPTSPQIVLVGDKTKGLGRATWRLFWGLVAAFALGVTALVLSLFSVYGAAFLQRTGW
jgi:hypothetical protein